MANKVDEFKFKCLISHRCVLGAYKALENKNKKLFFLFVFSYLKCGPLAVAVNLPYKAVDGDVY